MALTLSNGYILPESGDPNYHFDLADNITRLNSHNHDGVNSELLAVTTQSIASGSWGATSNGLFSQVVTLPGALQYDSISIEIRISTGEVIHPRIERASATTYTIFTNDNSLAYTALYST